MQISIFEKNYTTGGYYQGTEIFRLRTKHMKLNWFTDCGSWFIYIQIGKKWWRFSDAGCMKKSEPN